MTTGGKILASFLTLGVTITVSALVYKKFVLKKPIFGDADTDKNKAQKTTDAGIKAIANDGTFDVKKISAAQKAEFTKAGVPVLAGEGKAVPAKAGQGKGIDGMSFTNYSKNPVKWKTIFTNKI
jgi:hypothetical protein